MQAENSHNNTNLDRAVKAFAAAKLDISSIGLLWIIRNKEPLDMEVIVNQLSPRDYDIPLSHLELDRVWGAL